MHVVRRPNKGTFLNQLRKVSISLWLSFGSSIRFQRISKENINSNDWNKGRRKGDRRRDGTGKAISYWNPKRKCSWIICCFYFHLIYVNRNHSGNRNQDQDSSSTWKKKENREEIERLTGRSSSFSSAGRHCLQFQSQIRQFNWKRKEEICGLSQRGIEKETIKRWESNDPFWS